METREMIPSMFGPSRRKKRHQRRQPKRVNTVAGMKWCPRCEERKAVDAFGVNRDRPDGLTGECRECRAERSRTRRAANPELHRADVRVRYAENPDRWKAKVAVSRAIARGALQKPEPGTPCHCGRVAPLVAHHHRGHAKEHWLDVVWCCRSCLAPTAIQLKPVAPRWAKLGTHGVPARKVG